MNERMKQLAHQAWVTNDDFDLGGYTDLEKFGKSIILDCIDILAEYRGKVVWKNEDNIQHPIFAIKQHFGI